MKNFKILLLFPVVLLTTGCKPRDKYKKLIKPGFANVILIIGQSNASGNSPYEYLKETNPDVYERYKNGYEKILTSYYVHSSNNISYYEPTRFGMADSIKYFGPEIGIAEAFSSIEENTYIIKYAIGATILHYDWLNGNLERGKIYNDSIDWFKEKLEYLKSKKVEPKIKGMFWMQGEGDSREDIGPYYEQNTKNLISFYREDLKDYYENSFKFVDAYISTKTLWQRADLVNSAKQNIADNDPNVYCIKTNGEDKDSINLDIKSHSNQGDDMAHYDAQSQLLLGFTAGNIIKN